MAAIDQAWNTPPLSTASRVAMARYRLGIVELVAATGQAGDLLAEAVALDPTFFLARIGAAVADVAAGRPYRRATPTHRPLRGERQHGEIVDAELGGDRRRAADLRREHLLEYPGDLLIVWLPALAVSGVRSDGGARTDRTSDRQEAGRPMGSGGAAPGVDSAH